MKKDNATVSSQDATNMAAMMTKSPQHLAGEHPNVAVLRTIYDDLTRMKDYTHDDVIIHLAERGIPGADRYVAGREAVAKKENDLIRMTEGTLVLEVEQVVANDHFGAVIGRIRGQGEYQAFYTPICGLWRFENGLIVEHWENAYHTRLYHEVITDLSTQYFASEASAAPSEGYA